MTSTAHPLRITFLLPIPAVQPIGGFKVVYEYANFLAACGHKVNVVHPNMLRIDEPISSLGPKKQVKAHLRYWRMKLTNSYRPDHWFTVSPSVDMLWTKDLAAENVPDADIVFATAWETAEWAVTYPASKGKRFYIIQHLETWSGPEERVLKTWRSPFEKIVIAGWLNRINC